MYIVLRNFDEIEQPFFMTEGTMFMSTAITVITANVKLFKKPGKKQRRKKPSNLRAALISPLSRKAKTLWVHLMFYGKRLNVTGFLNFYKSTFLNFLLPFYVVSI